MCTDDGIVIIYQKNGSLFNLQKLQAKTNTRPSYFFDPQNADDAKYPTTACLFF